jgi:hypothetical protein
MQRTLVVPASRAITYFAIVFPAFLALGEKEGANSPPAFIEFQP